MTRTILLEERTISYELTRKNVKNINLRIHSDGTVTVSAPSHVPLEEIERILRKRTHFILGALNRFEDQKILTPKQPNYDEGELVCLLGKLLTLHLQKGPKNTVSVTDSCILLTVTSPEKETLRVKVMETFFRKTCFTMTTDFSQQLQPRMAPLGVPIPVIQVRSMISRWGTCKPSAQRITFAWQLIRTPPECIEYVVCHELSHFVHPNHSPAFYACISQFLPDWKMRRNQLHFYTPR